MTSKQPKSKCVDCDYRYAVGKSPRCNVCKRRRSKDRNHNANLKQRYGITIEEYYALLEDQQGTCAICDGGTSRNYFACDHDHKTGEVRGLLCATCNKALRNFRDNPERFDRAAKFLREIPSRRVLSERDWSWNIDAKG